jgi:hypothetical protein
MPADRPHDVSSLTAAQLERAKRDLEISLALAFPRFPRPRDDPGRDDRHRHRASPAPGDKGMTMPDPRGLPARRRAPCVIRSP